MSYDLLENSNTTVFWKIPPGKPNPAQLFPGTGKIDTRGRVNAPGQKNETCTYYAFNFFRERIGKHPDSDPGLRHIEKLFSQHRKNHTQLLNQKDHDIHTLTSIFLQSLSGHRNLSKEQRQLLQSLAVENDCNGQYSTQIVNKHTQSIIAINEDLLRKLSFDLDAFTQRFLVEAQRPVEPYSGLSADIKQIISSSAITFARLQHYPQLTISSWTIQDGPQQLMDEIRRFGPITARGYYGTEYYSKDALFSLKKPLCGHTISAWKPNTRCDVPQGAPTHSVAVIGLRNEENKFFVLFVDPKDESKLGNTRKIYQLSYDNFVKYMGDFYGLQTQDSPIPGKDCIIRYTQDAAQASLNYGPSR